MATPTFVAAGTVGQNAGTGNPTAPGIPAGTAAGHLLLCFVVSADNVVSTVAGFTNEATLTGNNGVNQRFGVFYKWAVGGDTAPAVTHAAGNSTSAVIIGVSGAGPGSGSPFAVLGTPSLNASSATVTATGITPSGTTDLVFFFGLSTQVGTGNPERVSPATGTNPTFTERVDSNNPNGSNECDFAVDTGPAGTGAATGTRTSTLSLNATPNMGVMFTVKDVTAAAAARAVTFGPRRTQARRIGPQSFVEQRTYSPPPVVVAAGQNNQSLPFFGVGS
jgi:hypothetical protein